MNKPPNDSDDGLSDTEPSTGESMDLDGPCRSPSFKDVLMTSILSPRHVPVPGGIANPRAAGTGRKNVMVANVGGQSSSEEEETGTPVASTAADPRSTRN